MKYQYDIRYDISSGEACPDRLQPFAGGGSKLKLFFVPSVKYGRESVEFIRRTGVQYETVTIDRAWDLNKWGFGDFYDIRASVDDQHIMYDNLEKAMTSEEHYDVLVIPGVNGWAHFTAATRAAIVRRVENGAGLVLIRPFHGQDKPKSPELEALSPLVNQFEEGFAVDNNAGEGYPKVRFDLLRSDKWEAAKPHYVTRGIPLELLPCEELAYYPYQAAEGAEVLIATPTGEPIAAARDYGRGRVVAFGYYPRDILPQHKDFTGKESTFDAVIDRWQGVRSGCTFAFLESFYELVFRSVTWAARREPDCVLEQPEQTEKGWHIRTSGAVSSDEIRYTIKNGYDDVVDAGICGSSGLLELTAAKPGLAAGGDFRVELNVYAEGELQDFATYGFSLPLFASISEATVSHQTAACGELVESSFQLQGGPGYLSVQVIDDYGQVLQQSEHEFRGDGGGGAGAGAEAEGEAVHVDAAPYQVASSKSMHITVHADVYVGGNRIQRWSSAPIVVTPEQRCIHDFEVFTAPQNRGHGDFLHLIGERFRELGITGLYPGSAKTLTMSGAEGLGIYWYHRAPYVERKENYYRTKDKQYLVRVPCLNDPEFWEGMERKITSKVSAFKHFGPIAYFANDEGSLTCYTDELDLCFCPHCMREMREWLKREYGGASGIAALNHSWGTSFTRWEDVMPYTREEAKAKASFAPWADHRRFMEHTFVEAYRRIANIVRSVDEDGVIRMSGCQASTAYSGYDYYRLHQHVGYFEAYGVGNQYEFHRSFAKPGTIIGGWFGYGVDGVTASHSVWHALYHGLTLCNLFWEYSLINPDYTFSASARDFSMPFKEIREEGIGKLLLHASQRDHCGIAVHYSMASVRGTTIVSDKSRFEKNRQGWIHLLEDCGYQYVFLASQQIEAGELLERGFKLLVLPYSIALSAEETEAIMRFVQEGGVIIGDFQTGLMDRHCALLMQGQLDPLFGIERLSLEAEPFYINNEFVPNADFPFFLLNDEIQGVRFAEIGIRSADGHPAFRDDFMRKVSAVHVRTVGAGKAIYLNIAMTDYAELRDKGADGDSIRALLRELIGLSAAGKPAELLQADGAPAHAGYESFYYRSENAAYVAVIRGVSGKRTLGHDGLAVGAGKKQYGDSEQLRFAFTKQAHVYDIREQRYVGLTDTAEFELAEGDTKLFALLPCRVNGISLSSPSLEWKLGEKASVSIDLLTDEPQHHFASVICFQLTDPGGKRQWLYDENLTLTGNRATHELIIPFNERIGKWTITAKDAATGISARLEVIIA
ncbi:beta-galactosidase [Paenibacillus sp. OV219]|uniref:beta-galactosidase n=1 Tax=Paenibacillus sp. OV219 TaxID=1884377 RepID=UPI0008CFD6E6|nr:beta-galactosidase [Paenibacillus sp. OV219]SEN87756.1 Beta-galactosidase trimerisation domain-containing protein [Paenibacillus sp. OV219]